MSSFLDALDNIRLGSVMQENNKRGWPNVEYSIETPEDLAAPLIDIFGLNELHIKRPKFNGISGY
jgi:hypothetical protein